MNTTTRRLRLESPPSARAAHAVGLSITTPAAPSAAARPRKARRFIVVAGAPCAHRSLPRSLFTTASLRLPLAHHEFRTAEDKRGAQLCRCGFERLARVGRKVAA